MDGEAKREPVLINNIQALRAFAAISVVFLHATHEPGLPMPLSYGNFGVDVFFVISGFIIPYIADKDPHQFELKRIVRIVPLYWAATIGIFFVALFFPRLLHYTTADWRTLFTSLFFIPHDRPNGGIEPMLFLGWTLNYEMYFYAIFAVSLRICRQWSSLIAAAAILAIMAVINSVAPISAAERFYGNPIVVEFIYGIVLFHIFRRYPVDRNSHNLGSGFWLCIGAALAALVLLLAPEYFHLLRLRFIFAGAPAAILLACAIVFERRYAMTVRNRTILLAGNASYVLYLLHPYVVFGLLRFPFRGADAWPGLAQWTLVGFLIIASTATAVIVHLSLEQPAMNALRRQLLNKSRRVVDRRIAPASTA